MSSVLLPSNDSRDDADGKRTISKAHDNPMNTANRNICTKCPLCQKDCPARKCILNSFKRLI